MSQKPNDMILFHSEDGAVRINVQLGDETLWLTQRLMAELFDCTSDNISLHLRNIFADGELKEDSVTEEFSVTAKDGKKYKTKHYNLDAIIAVGYRVNSKRATQFRIWATSVLKEYIIKGFALNDERLKNGGGRYFRELLQRIRDIRSSERNLYQQVTDIYVTAIDYDPKASITREFFATVQNKMHFAAHKHTAAEVIYERVDSDKPMVGMTNFKGDYITKSDVSIAKNYLTERELTVLNLLVSQFLDFAELQALEENAMTMANWITELDRQLLGNRRALLTDKGRVSHKQAVKKAEKEFETYRTREMRQLESDFDRAVKQLLQRDAGVDDEQN